MLGYGRVSGRGTERDGEMEIKRYGLSRIFWAKEEPQGELRIKYSYLFDDSKENRLKVATIVAAKQRDINNEPQVLRTNAASKNKGKTAN